MNSYREDAESNCGAPPITIGAFIPVGDIQNQHARGSSPPTKEVKPPRRRRGRSLEESWKAQARACVYIKIDQLYLMNQLVYFYIHHESWYDWGSLGVGALPILSLPHPDLLHSSSTTQNERSARFFKCA